MAFCTTVIVDSSTSPQTVYFYELTVCFEREVNIEAANRKKYNSYCGLATDIEHNGYKCKNFPNEVGSRGHLTPDKRSRLCILHKLCKPNIQFSKFCQNISKTSLLCSYAIFLSRNDPWTGAEYIMPVKQWLVINLWKHYYLYIHICWRQTVLRERLWLKMLRAYLLTWMLLLVVYCQFIIFYLP